MKNFVLYSEDAWVLVCDKWKNVFKWAV